MRTFAVRSGWAASATVDHGQTSRLSRDERRRAESAFSRASNCVIVATRSLELDIYAGDLDGVIQIDSPHTVASFLQRLGRSGPRAGIRRNCFEAVMNP
jgi:ATP-dependent helicase Lhr and Lhr-like helicase